MQVSHTLALLQERFDNAPMITFKETAKQVLMISESTLHRMIASPEANGIKYTRIGQGRGRIMFRLQDLAEYIDASVAA